MMGKTMERKERHHVVEESETNDEVLGGSVVGEVKAMCFLSKLLVLCEEQGPIKIEVRLFGEGGRSHGGLALMGNSTGFEWKDNDMHVYGEDGDGDEESNRELGDSCNEDPVSFCVITFDMSLDM
ncbi:hypothetical protein Tco_0121809 [Tanacetum coccineum]